MNNDTIAEPQPPVFNPIRADVLIRQYAKVEKRTIGVALPAYTRIGELAAQNRTHRGEMVELLLALWERTPPEARAAAILGRVGL